MFVSVVESPPESVKLRINVDFDTKSMSVDCMAIGGQPAPIDFQWRLDGTILNRTSIRREEFDKIGRKVYIDTLTFGRGTKRRNGVVNCQVFHEGWKSTPQEHWSLQPQLADRSNWDETMVETVGRRLAIKNISI